MGDTITGGRGPTRLGYATNNYVALQRDLSTRTELTITRVAPAEPEKVGTVVEYARDGVTRTAIKYSNDPVVEYPWIREDGYRLSWSEILEYDPDPKIG